MKKENKKIDTSESAERTLFETLERFAHDNPHLLICNGVVTFYYKKDNKGNPIYCDITWYNSDKPEQGLKKIMIPGPGSSLIHNLTYESNPNLYKYEQAVYLYNDIIQGLDYYGEDYIYQEFLNAVENQGESDELKFGGYNWPFQKIKDEMHQNSYSSEEIEKELDEWELDVYDRAGLTRQKVYSLWSKINTPIKIN